MPHRVLALSPQRSLASDGRRALPLPFLSKGLGSSLLWLLFCVVGAAAAEDHSRQWITGRVLELPDKGERARDRRVLNGSPDGVVAKLFLVEGEHAFLHRALTGEEPVPELEARPDRAGLFRLATPHPGPWWVRVKAPGFVAMERWIPPLPQEIDLPPVHLWRAQEERLQIVDPEGEPSERAWWRLTDELDPQHRRLSDSTGWRRALRSGWTDSEGMLDLKRGRGETLWLEVSNDWGRELVSIGPAVGGGGVEHEPWLEAFDLTLVATREGEPVGGAVVLVDGRPAGLTDSEGSATVRVGSGSGVVVATADHWGKLGGAQFLSGERDLAEAEPIAVALAPLLPRRALVLDASSGQPLAGAMLVAGSLVAVADDIGRLRWASAIQSNAPVWLGAGGYRAATFEPTNEVVEIRLQPASIVEGRVTHEGRSASGVELQIKGRGHSYPQGSLWSRSHDDGTFRIYGLAPKSAHTATASWHGMVAEARFGSAAPFSRRSDLLIEMPRLLTAVGRVVEVDEEGMEEPLGDAVVRIAVWQPGGEIDFETHSMHSGRFEIADVPFSQSGFLVRASKTGYVPAFDRVSGVEIKESAESDGELDLGTLRLERGVELAIRAVDEQGYPVEGARAETRSRARPSGFVGSPSGGFIPAEGSTDAEGRLVLGELKRGFLLSVRLFAEGFVAAEAEDVPLPQEQPLEIELIEAGSLSGWVLAEDGDPIANAHVDLASLNPNDPLPQGLATRTNRLGEFLVDGVPAGTFKLWARAYGKARIEPITLALDRGEEVRELVFRVPESAVVEGMVLDSDGRGVTDATVVCGGVLESTDSRGAFRLVGVELGTQQIEVRPQAGPGLTRAIEVPRGGAYVELELQNGVEVSGIVTGLDVGESSEGLWVALIPETTRRWIRQNVEGGSFHFVGVLPGRYELRAGVRSGRVFEPLTIDVEDRPLDQIEIELRSSTRLSGFVGGLSDAPVADRSRRLSLRATERRGSSVSAMVEADGPYEVRGLFPGSWTVTGQLGGVMAPEQYRVEVGDGDREVELDLEFSFEEGSALAGTVVVDGKALARAWVLVALPGGPPVQFASTNYFGEFEVDVSPGEYDLLVAASGTALTFVRTVHVEGSTEVVLDLERVVVHGLVQDAAGQPIAGALLTVFSKGERVDYRPRRGLTHTISSGRFQLEALVEGAFRVRVEADGYLPAEHTVSSGGPGQVEEIAVTLSRRQ